MKHTKLFTIVFACLMLSLSIFSTLSLAKTDVGIIGGADGPTAVIVSEQDTKEDNEINLNFEPYNFVKNLDIMGKGMLGIFIVIGIIIIAVYLLGFIGKKRD